MMTGLRRCLGLTLVVLAAAGLTACSKDKEVEAVLADLDGFTSGLVGKVKAAATPQAGVAEAQRFLEQDGAALRGKLAAIKEVRGYQITAETKKKLESSFTSNATAVASLQIEYAMQAARDEAFRRGLEKLVTDYRDLLLK
jgi:hypothetical protein